MKAESTTRPHGTVYCCPVSVSRLRLSWPVWRRCLAAVPQNLWESSNNLGIVLIIQRRLNARQLLCPATMGKRATGTSEGAAAYNKRQKTYHHDVPTGEDVFDSDHLRRLLAFDQNMRNARHGTMDIYPSIFSIGILLTPSSPSILQADSRRSLLQRRRVRDQDRNHPWLPQGHQAPGRWGGCCLPKRHHGDVVLCCPGQR